MRHKFAATAALARATFLETWRSALPLAAGGLVLVLMGLAMLLGGVAAAERSRLALDVGLATQAGLGSVLAVGLGMASFGMPLHSGEAYPYLVRPLPRWTFVAGRYVGILAMLTLLQGFAGVVLALSQVGAEPAWTPSLALWSLLLGVGQMAMVLALTCLFWRACRCARSPPTGCRWTQPSWAQPCSTPASTPALPSPPAWR